MLINTRLPVLKSILSHLESWGGVESSPGAVAGVPLRGSWVTIPGQTQTSCLSRFFGIDTELSAKPPG